MTVWTEYEAAMSSAKSLIAAIAVAALPLLCSTPQAGAQTVSSPVESPDLATPSPPPTGRYAGRRIEIYPARPLYRRCVDWYELQHRPSGTVLFPQMRCWWVRG
jgi:hypothetical protein